MGGPGGGGGTRFPTCEGGWASGAAARGEGARDLFANPRPPSLSAMPGGGLGSGGGGGGGCHAPGGGGVDLNIYGSN